MSKFPPLRHVRDAERVFEGWTTYWIREDEKNNIGPIKCRKIEYRAFFDLMYAVTLEIDESDCFLMSDILTKARGKNLVLKRNWMKSGLRIVFVMNRIGILTSPT